MSHDLSRYHRQMLLPGFGEEGQRRLLASKAVVLGCGALGTVIADQLARAGVAHLRIADRDIVELTNLQRQTLFDETSINQPKATAAATRLSAINSSITIEPLIVDVTSDNIESLCDGIDLILDGTDNAETRYLINDAAVKLNKPWVYGGCVGTGGIVMPIVPGKTACLRCVFPTPPAPGELPTCDTAGVLAAAANVVASLQVVEGMKILVGDDSALQLTRVQLWPTRITSVAVADAPGAACPTCALGHFEFLQMRPGSMAITLCGRNTVQLKPHSGSAVNIAAVRQRLHATAAVMADGDSHLRCELNDGLRLTLFADGRALVHGTSDPALARSIYAKFVGS
jgi:adenylyltransferase/sulfurtransferase